MTERKAQYEKEMHGFFDERLFSTKINPTYETEAEKDTKGGAC